MSRKTKPELDAPDDEVVELDEQTDDVDDQDDVDADPAPAKRGSKVSGAKVSGAKTSSSKDSESKDSGTKSSKDSGSKNSGSKNGTAKRGGTKKSRSTGGRGSAKSGASKSALVSGGKRPGKGGGKAPRAIKPVKVSSDKPWGTIALFAVVAVLFVSIVGYTSYLAWYSAKSPAERANMISGVTDYSDDVGKAGQHDDADLKYDMSPPVGGTHNPVWQNCMGDVYDKPIADEHAVHSLEHGAIWITYQPDLPKQQVAQLAKKVRGKDFMMLSPYKGLKSPISVQAWGYQLKVDDAGDSRIDDFIKALRTHGPEKGAACSGGVTVPGDKPREVQPPQQPGGAPGAPGAPPGAPPGGGAPAPAPGG